MRDISSNCCLSPEAMHAWKMNFSFWTGPQFQGDEPFVSGGGKKPFWFHFFWGEEWWQVFGWIHLWIHLWIHGLGGGFKYFLFSSLLGEMIQFDECVSNGLKPPTSGGFLVFWSSWCVQISRVLLVKSSKKTHQKHLKNAWNIMSGDPMKETKTTWFSEVFFLRCNHAPQKLSFCLLEACHFQMEKLHVGCGLQSEHFSASHVTFRGGGMYMNIH